MRECDENQLFPTDCVSHLHASAIFKVNDSFLLTDDDSGSNSLPESIYKNIHAFKQAAQRRVLYMPPHSYTTMNEMALNNVITSTYLLDSRPRIKDKLPYLFLPFCVRCFLLTMKSQVQFDNTYWVFKQQDNSDNESLRPGIIFYCRQQEEVVEVGCGEVKKPVVSQALPDEAKKDYEAATFGILVQGNVIEEAVLYVLLNIFVLQRYNGRITENANGSWYICIMKNFHSLCLPHMTPMHKRILC